METLPLGLLDAAAEQDLLLGVEKDWTDTKAFEAESFARVFATRDQEEGMTAFLEKRSPVSTGV